MPAPTLVPFTKQPWSTLNGNRLTDPCRHDRIDPRDQCQGLFHRNTDVLDSLPQKRLPLLCGPLLHCRAVDHNRADSAPGIRRRRAPLRVLNRPAARLTDGQRRFPKTHVNSTRLLKRKYLNWMQTAQKVTSLWRTNFLCQPLPLDANQTPNNKRWQSRLQPNRAAKCLAVLVHTTRRKKRQRWRGTVPRTISRRL